MTSTQLLVGMVLHEVLGVWHHYNSLHDLTLPLPSACYENFNIAAPRSLKFESFALETWARSQLCFQAKTGPKHTDETLRLLKLHETAIKIAVSAKPRTVRCSRLSLSCFLRRDGHLWTCAMSTLAKYFQSTRGFLEQHMLGNPEQRRSIETHGPHVSTLGPLVGESRLPTGRLLDPWISLQEC